MAQKSPLRWVDCKTDDGTRKMRIWYQFEPFKVSSVEIQKTLWDDVPEGLKTESEVWTMLGVDTG